ncbi:GTPase-activating Rap/Ran-GAP domain-like protein 3 isoform X2 [Gordionus sp. m RMFG-2023]|uniref:GTPase-activating Rap/Ran-GAP domain-like protein 3 isoform X2 n=1 Tax=Gordionus sp. m RMFG-2023 TaxID=3053472 RepID=UPI0031FE322E
MFNLYDFSVIHNIWEAVHICGPRDTQPYLINSPSNEYNDQQINVLDLTSIINPNLKNKNNKRTGISRKHYGSVETLKSHEMPEGYTNYPTRFKVEYGEFDNSQTISAPPNTPVHLENPEFQTRWYFKYFLGKMHQNFIGIYGPEKGDIFILSIVLTDANNHNVPQYRAILWTKKGAEKMCLPYIPNKALSTKAILSAFSSIDKIEGPREITNPNLQKDLAILEEQEGSINFKFGVVYAKHDQKSDDEMLSNEHGSEDFNKFLNLLGQKVKLKGWTRFRGGLDIKNNTTGEDTIFTLYEGNEIIFHVSTMLPYSHDNSQQLERKRHIGNDIVVIIYEDGDEPGHHEKPTFQPGMFKSQFTHIFALVTFLKEKNSYRLEVFSEENVPIFGPPLRNSPEFPNHQEFRDFLLVKLINGEKAAFNTPIFKLKRERTLDMLLHNYYDIHVGSSEIFKPEKNHLMYRRALSDVFIESPKANKRKEDVKQVEFLRTGQILKLNTIVKGDAPTNISASSLLRREPWEPNCFYANYMHEIISGDSFGSNLVIVTKDAGIFLFEEGCEPRMLFDKSVTAKQLSVFEEHGILIFLSNRGRESKIIVYKLKDFVGQENQTLIRNRNQCKENKIETTRGCHMYAANRPSSTRLKVAVCISKKLLLMEWKHLAYWSSWYPQSDFDIVEGFQYIKEITLPDVPQAMVWLDAEKAENTYICAGYKNYFDIINESSSHLERLLTIDNKTNNNILNIIDVTEDNEFEVMLCYNRNVYFKKPFEEEEECYEFRWNSIPDSIVCTFPYILGFTSNGIEIRLAINGNLVDTIELPSVKLICSKNDIFFDSPVPDAYVVMRSREKEKENMHSQNQAGSSFNYNVNQNNNTWDTNFSCNSPPISPSTKIPIHIYQISINSFLGTHNNYAYNNKTHNVTRHSSACNENNLNLVSPATIRRRRRQPPFPDSNTCPSDINHGIECKDLANDHLSYTSSNSASLDTKCGNKDTPNFSVESSDIFLQMKNGVMGPPVKGEFRSCTSASENLGDHQVVNNNNTLKKKAQNISISSTTKSQGAQRVIPETRSSRQSVTQNKRVSKSELKNLIISGKNESKKKHSYS